MASRLVAGRAPAPACGARPGLGRVVPAGRAVRSDNAARDQETLFVGASAHSASCAGISARGIYGPTWCYANEGVFVPQLSGVLSVVSTITQPNEVAREIEGARNGVYRR